jgi:hypothetical protein
MEEPRPFDLVPLGDGCFELRAFSDDSEDPIRITLDPEAGRKLAVALGEALVSGLAPDEERRVFRVPAGDRLIVVTALTEGRIRVTVTR